MNNKPINPPRRRVRTRNAESIAASNSAPPRRPAVSRAPYRWDDDGIALRELGYCPLWDRFSE
jgi:hypothetical protein